jgi:hypothetical protein
MDNFSDTLKDMQDTNRGLAIPPEPLFNAFNHFEQHKYRQRTIKKKEILCVRKK